MQVLYVFLFAATVGTFFSSFIVVVFLAQGTEFPLPLPVVSFGLRPLSGCGGVIGLIMDKLFKRLSRKNEGLAMGLSYLSTIAAFFVLAFLLALLTGYLEKALSTFIPFDLVYLAGLFIWRNCRSYSVLLCEVRR